MRLVTSARLRAVGVLLLEAAGLAVIIMEHVNKNDSLRDAFNNFIRKARTL